MKQAITTLFLALFFMTGCDYLVDPGDYNDQVVDIHGRAIDVYNEYFEETELTDLESDQLDVLEKLRQDTMVQIKSIREELRAVGPLRKDAALVDAFVADLDQLLESMDTMDKELIQLWKKMSQTEGEIPQEDLDRENELLDDIEEVNARTDRKASQVQEAFAEKYGYELKDEY